MPPTFGSKLWKTVKTGCLGLAAAQGGYMLLVPPPHEPDEWLLGIEAEPPVNSSSRPVGDQASALPRA